MSKVSVAPQPSQHLMSVFWIFAILVGVGASLGAQLVKNPPAMLETQVRSQGWEDPLEEDMATHSNILPGESPWTEEPFPLGQSMGPQRVGHD